jgi:hypothetical protein
MVEVYVRPGRVGLSEAVAILIGDGLRNA